MAETFEGGGLHVEYHNNEYNSAQSKYNHHKYNWKSYTKVFVYMFQNQLQYDDKNKLLTVYRPILKALKFSCFTDFLRIQVVLKKSVNN